MISPQPVLDPAHFPRVLTLTDGSKVRVTRCDATDIAFDRIAPRGTTPETYTVLAPAQGAAPIAGFNPATAQQWPTDAALVAAIEAPQPAVAAVTVLTPLQILGRLTQAEEAALASSTDLAVTIVRNRLIAASEVRSDDPRTAEGKAILIAKGIITAQRAAAVFA